MINLPGIVLVLLSLTFVDNSIPANFHIPYRASDSYESYAGAAPTQDGCEILLNPAFWELHSEEQFLILRHEAMHCLGAWEHPPSYIISLMTGTGYWNMRLSYWDRLKLAELWPSPIKSRLIIGSIASE